MTERLEKLDRLRERQDDVIQAMRRREARLLAEADMQRDTTAELRMQVVEMRNLAAAAEAARGEMHLQLATRAAEFDRLQRDHDTLHEKDLSGANELEANLKRQAELRRKLEDLQTAQTQDAGRTSELTNKMLTQEIEIQRLQRQIDLSETQLSEVNDARRAGRAGSARQRTPPSGGNVGDPRRTRTVESQHSLRERRRAVRNKSARHRTG